jgi:replicative DNA helicase
MGEGVFIASLEMPKAQLLLRILCSEARVDLGKILAGKLQRADWDALTDAAGFVSKLPIWIDDTPAISSATLRAKAKSVAGQCERAGTKLGLVVADYLQLFSGNGTETSREQEVANCSKSMKTLAKELACPVIVLSQLNRDVERRGKKGRPQLSDLRESGSVEQDADTIMFIHNEDVANQSEIKSGIAEWIIAKQRNGPTGKIYMGFDGYCTRFRELKPDEYPRENDDE